MRWCSGFKVSRKHVLTNIIVREGCFFDHGKSSIGFDNLFHQGKIAIGFDKLIEKEHEVLKDAYMLSFDGQIKSTPTPDNFKHNRLVNRSLSPREDLDFAL